MAKITFTELSKQLKKGIVAPVYLFTGDDVYRKLEAAEQIKELVNPDEFNYMREDGSSCKMADIVAAASTAPVFSQRRMILLNNVDKIRKNSNALKVLAEYLANPLQSTCFVILHNDSKKSKKDKTLESSCSEDSIITDFAEIKGLQLNNWIKQHCMQKGLEIDEQALITLQQVIGANLMALNTEIEKLSLYLLDRQDKTITVNDVLSCVGLSKEEDPFALNNAILDLDRNTCLQLVQTLLDKGEEPISILNKISACALKMLRIKRLSEAGLRGQEIVQAAGLMYWEGGLAAKAYLMPSSARLLKSLDKIIETDMAFKSSSVSNPAIQIKGLIMCLLDK